MHPTLLSLFFLFIMRYIPILIQLLCFIVVIRMNRLENELVIVVSVVFFFAGFILPKKSL